MAREIRSLRPWIESPCLRLVCLLVAASAAFPRGAGAGGDDRTEETESLKPLVKRLAGNIGQDQKQIWTSPFRITRKNARWWLAFGAATSLLIATDRRTSRQLPNTADQVAFSSHVSQVGAAYTLIPTAGGLYLSGLLAHDAKLRETGLLGGEALADALIVSEVLKLAAGRQRPLEGDGSGHFFHAGSSFPSGHAIGSFALASVISHRYGNRRLRSSPMDSPDWSALPGSARENTLRQTSWREGRWGGLLAGMCPKLTRTRRGPSGRRPERGLLLR